jgi:hypothetical protein
LPRVPRVPRVSGLVNLGLAPVGVIRLAAIEQPLQRAEMTVTFASWLGCAGALLRRGVRLADLTTDRISRRLNAGPRNGVKLPPHSGSLFFLAQCTKRADLAYSTWPTESLSDQKLSQWAPALPQRPALRDFSPAYDCLGS